MRIFAPPHPLGPYLVLFGNGSVCFFVVSLRVFLESFWGSWARSTGLLAPLGPLGSCAFFWRPFESLGSVWFHLEVHLGLSWSPFGGHRLL